MKNRFFIVLGCLLLLSGVSLVAQDDGGLLNAVAASLDERGVDKETSKAVIEDLKAKCVKQQLNATGFIDFVGSGSTFSLLQSKHDCRVKVIYRSSTGEWKKRWYRLDLTFWGPMIDFSLSKISFIFLNKPVEFYESEGILDLQGGLDISFPPLLLIVPFFANWWLWPAAGLFSVGFSRVNICDVNPSAQILSYSVVGGFRMGIGMSWRGTLIPMTEHCDFH
jgi:hypothetical protein